MILSLRHPTERPHVNSPERTEGTGRFHFEGAQLQPLSPRPYRGRAESGTQMTLPKEPGFLVAQSLEEPNPSQKGGTGSESL